MYESICMTKFNVRQKEMLYMTVRNLKKRTCLVRT